MLSIIIPVYKETKQIRKNILDLKLLCKDLDYEIIVCDIPSQDSLNEIKDFDVIKVVSQKGRGDQQNAGANRASKEILLFLHIDTKLPNDFFDEITKSINKKILVGAFDLKIDNKNFIFRIIEKISSLRSRITKIPYGDQAIFINRELFFELGSFRNYPIMEDVDLMYRIKKRGIKIFISNKKVLTSDRRWQKEGIFYATCRNWILLTLFFIGISPNYLAKFYK